MTSSKGEIPPPCPDPSVHPEYVAGQDSANKAAQLATQHSPSSSRDIEALGPDGRLSAAGAATSLRYARAQDLPSFPSVGIDTVSSGNKAANLASSNQKPIEPWRPELSSSAGKAALLAAKDGGKLEWWEYKADGTGNTAATAAMKANTSPQLDYGYTKDGHRRALEAASKSLSTRDKSSSPAPSTQPPSYPDQRNAGFNALNAATVANRPSSTDYHFSDPGMEAARVKHMQGVSRDMYGDRPQVALEVEEKRRQDALHASAVSMAKQLYDLERDDINRLSTNPGSVAAERVARDSYHSATTNTSGDALRVQAMNYIKVQEAAQKLAAERLAKLDPDGVLAYREHYGYGNQGSKSKFSMLRGKGSSSGQADAIDHDADSSDDEVQAAKIKSQMSNLNNQVASVDAAKRAQDRESLMAAAERAVQTRMHNMDEKVFSETGKMSPAMAAEWEAKAKAKAAADSEQRMANHGKVHIGGGKYMDQSEIDAIAAGRMQPTLDEINDEAERRRAQEAAIKADLEHQREQAELAKQRDREVKAELKKTQDEEKEKIRQEKAAEKEKIRQEQAAEKERLRQEREAEKDKQNVEKMQRDLEKRMAKAEAKQAKEQEKFERETRERLRVEELAAKRKQAEEDKAAQEKDAPAIVNAPVAVDVLENAPEAPSPEPATVRAVEEPSATTPTATATTATTATAAVAAAEPAVEETQADTTTSPRRDSKLKGLFGKITGKRSSKAEADNPEETTQPISPTDPAKEVQETQELSEKAKGKQRASLDSVSSVSRSDSPLDTGNDVFEEARDTFDNDAAPARTSMASAGDSGSKNSKFQEQL